MVSLAGAGAAAAVAVLGTGSAFAWLALAVVATVAGFYGAGLRKLHTVRAEREFRHQLGSADFLAAIGARTAVLPAPVVPPAPNEALALLRFSAACVAGWALSPLVFALTVLVGRTPKDSTGQRWLANLQRAQGQLKEHSVRTLMVSAATTASVTGGVAAFGGAGVATAAPLTATAPAAAHVASTAPTATSAPASSVYRVAAGDTLSAIATRFGTTWQALASANRIADPNMIYAGQVLDIGPGGTSPPASSVRSSTYTVQAGDTLSSIASRFGTTFQALAAANGITNPDLIEVGRVLRTSGGAAVHSPVGVPAQARPVVTVSAPVATRTTPPPAPVPAPATSNRGELAARVALEQVGKPYVWAGSGPNGFDCSGLVMYAWAAAGVSLPHYSVAQYQDTSRISESELQPGDLVFYDSGSGAQPGHVVLYTGNGQIVTADSPGTSIRVEALTWDGTPIGFGRIG